MRSRAERRIISKEPPKFFSLFVPNITWFQKLLKSRAERGSLSDYLIDLIVKDLKSRNLLTDTEFQSYLEYVDKKPDIRQTRFNGQKELHTTFSLYIPKRESQKWIRTKLASEFLKENCRAKSRSRYIWDLFVRENEKKLTKSQLAEWADELLNTKPEPPVPKGKKSVYDRAG